MPWLCVATTTPSTCRSTAQLEYNAEFYVRTKHISISYQFLRDLVQLDIVYINTHLNRDEHLSYKIDVIVDLGGVLEMPRPSPVCM